MRKVDPNILQIILQYAGTPLGAFFLWVAKKQHTVSAEHQKKVEKMEARLTSVETSTAVIRVMVDSIHQDIRDIKRSIEKLADRD